MAKAFMDLGYKVISGGTDNHSMLIDLRTKFPDITGKKVENTLVLADITINKNMLSNAILPLFWHAVRGSLYGEESKLKPAILQWTLCRPYEPVA